MPVPHKQDNILNKQQLPQLAEVADTVAVEVTVILQNIRFASVIREYSLQRLATTEPSALISGFVINEFARKKLKFQLFCSGSIYRISRLIICFFND
ncbi:MAG: hypothetical protein EZS28_050549, partial [Streblomastix strix]